MYAMTVQTYIWAVQPATRGEKVIYNEARPSSVSWSLAVSGTTIKPQIPRPDDICYDNPNIHVGCTARGEG